MEAGGLHRKGLQFKQNAAKIAKANPASPKGGGISVAQGKRNATLGGNQGENCALKGHFNFNRASGSVKRVG